MHNTALQPCGCAQVYARRVHMPCLIIMHFSIPIAARKEAT